MPSKCDIFNPKLTQIRRRDNAHVEGRLVIGIEENAGTEQAISEEG